MRETSFNYDELESPELADMINNASIDRIFAIDTHNRITAWNKSCELLTDVKKTDVLDNDLFSVFPEITDNVHILKAITGAQHGHRMFLSPDKGSCFGGHHESHFIPLKLDDTVMGVMCLMHDVAHRVKTENELKALNKALAKKNKELKAKNAELLSFSKVTAHDLKEPLRKIYTFIEMLATTETDKLSADGKGIFKRIQGSVQRMGMLTDDLFNYSQVQTVTEELTVVDLDRTLKVARNMLTDLTEKKKAIITAEKLPVIHGYRTMLADLMLRILGNSLKFQPEGQVPVIRITVDTVQGTDIGDSNAVADSTYHCISITDNGIGFDKKYAELVFGMFQRIHTGAKYTGTGMGLAICKKIMDMHNGSITAESEEGKGSTFKCYFPIARN